jgi:hypothetical protein
MQILTPEQAIARLQPSGKAKARGKQPSLELIDIVEDAAYIVGNEDGNILTPRYDGIQPVIGAWEEKGDEMPPALVDWLQEYASEIEWFNRVGESLPTPTDAQAHAPKAPRQSIPTLMETKWSQKSPYNDKIVFDGKKCPTGCNTTAAAQILFYYAKKGFHRGCKPTDAYLTASNGYEVEALPSLVTFDYANLVAKPKTDKQKAAVAQLMEYIAYTFHSDFKVNGTGANPKQVATYLKENLRMGSFISYITAAKLGLSSFENYIYNELLQGRPVMVAGWTTSGGGHTFAVDGYDATNDLYHVNWGWGGSYDGWFAMSALNPKTSIAYNSKKVAIIGIQPDYKLGDINNDGEVDIVDVMQVVHDAQQGKYSDKADLNYDGKVTITDAQLLIDKILGKNR